MLSLLSLSQLLIFVAVAAGLAVIAALVATFFMVEQRTTAIVQRLGKFVREAGPGLHVMRNAMIEANQTVQASEGSAEALPELSTAAEESRVEQRLGAVAVPNLPVCTPEPI